jgi:hypothetical protein
LLELSEVVGISPLPEILHHAAPAIFDLKIGPGVRAVFGKAVKVAAAELFVGSFH